MERIVVFIYGNIISTILLENSMNWKTKVLLIFGITICILVNPEMDLLLINWENCKPEYNTEISNSTEKKTIHNSHFSNKVCLAVVIFIG